MSKFNELELDEELKSEIEQHSEEYACVGFVTSRTLMKPFKKKDITPDEIKEVGQFLSDKWQEEVLDKIDDIIIEFLKENDLMPVSQIDIVGTSTLTALMARAEMMSMGASLGN